MDTFSPTKSRKRKVATRILFSQEDYLELKRIAEMERTDISNLVRRAVAHHFFIPANSNNIKQV